MSNFDISNASFKKELRMLETSDPVHADVFNVLFGQLINNDVALMNGLVSDKNKQVEFILNLHKTGKRYGVHFENFSVSPTPVGTRKLDAIGMEAHPATDKEAARNDFENESVFFGLEVNGRVDANGEFQVQFIKGIDEEFSRTLYDTYILYLTQWISITINAYGEDKVLSDTPHSGFFPEGGAIRPDGTIRPFVAIAKYMASKGDDGKMASVSGRKIEVMQSYDACVANFHAKGKQYCSITVQDWERMNNLFDVAFATRNSQSVMTGCTSYYYQYPATVVESGVQRIIISKANAANLVVGSTVSIGNATALSGASPNIDRGQEGMHAKADRVKITSIDDYDDTNSVVTVDNGGSTFSTAATMVSSTPCPTYISTMPWRTGACDGVLGSCGSVNSNTNYKNPYILFGVEMMNGTVEVCGNAMMSFSSSVMKPYVCYDSINLVAATAPTGNYKTVNYPVALTENVWKYISVLGYDPDNPMVRFATEAKAESSTGYCDGIHTGVTVASGQREILLGGALNGGEVAGRRYADLNNALAYANWAIAARLSASGRCAQAAA